MPRHHEIPATPENVVYGYLDAATPPVLHRPRRRLDDAAKQAVREMVQHVCARTNLSRNQAYMLCSLIGDLRVTQTVDGNKGVHMMLAKRHI